MIPHSPPTRRTCLPGAAIAVGLAISSTHLPAQDPLDDPELVGWDAPCPPATEPGTAVIFGLVRDAGTDTPLPGGRANVRWAPAAPEGVAAEDTAGIEARERVSDLEGRYWFCAVPTGVELIVWADALGRGGRPGILRLEESGSRRHDLRIAFGSPTGAVAGRLEDAASGEPIGEAALRIEKLGRGVLTDAEGRFRLPDLPPGDYELRVRHVAYGEQAVSVEVTAERTAQLRVRVAPVAIAMEPIAARVEQRPRWLEDAGFYHRRSRGLGQFLSPEDLEKRHLRGMVQVLENVPGLELRRICRPHCSYRLETPTTTAFCTPQFYIDGKKLWMPAVADLDALVSSVHDVAAVEVYRGVSQTPAQYFGRCGSIVIWTKRTG